jgi:hypothetical protein
LVCARCGHRPIDDGLLVAWLLSEGHLDEEQLQDVALRIKNGETIRPSETQLKQARRALGQSFTTDPGLTGNQRLLLLAVSFLFTPLPAWVCFFWWWTPRPRAAWQSLSVALPASGVFFVLGLAVLLA